MRFLERIKYLPVAQDANHPGLETKNRSYTRKPSLLTSPWKILVILLFVMIASVSFLATLYDSLPAWSGPSRAAAFNEKPCGETAAEARAAGCKYDVMMDEWLSDDCYDKELTEEFRALREWEFYADKNHTQPITEEQLSESITAHTTIEYHIAHCGYALRKLHRAIEHGRKIETNVAARGHTDHCAYYLWLMAWRLEKVNHGSARDFSIQDVGTVLRPAFPACVDYKEIDQWAGKPHGHQVHGI